MSYSLIWNKSTFLVFHDTDTLKSNNLSPYFGFVCLLMTDSDEAILTGIVYIRCVLFSHHIRAHIVTV